MNRETLMGVNYQADYQIDYNLLLKNYDYLIIY